MENLGGFATFGKVKAASCGHASGLQTRERGDEGLVLDLAGTVGEGWEVDFAINPTGQHQVAIAFLF